MPTHLELARHELDELRVAHALRLHADTAVSTRATLLLELVEAQAAARRAARALVEHEQRHGREALDLADAVVRHLAAAGRGAGSGRGGA